LYRITIPKDDCWKVVEALGNLGDCHLINMNRDESAHKLPFWKQLLECDETEKRLSFLLNYCKEMRVPMVKPQSAQEFNEKIVHIAEELKVASNLIFGKISTEADKAEKFVQK
jgi:hypothetical protein